MNAAVGCADIGDVENAVVERRFDLAIIRCNATTETYFLTCVNTRWTGEMSPCTTGSISITRSLRYMYQHDQQQHDIHRLRLVSRIIVITISCIIIIIIIIIIIMVNVMFVLS